MRQYRQGDIFFERAEEIPCDSKIVKDGIIARGESTGHMHRISDSTKAVLYLVAMVQYIHANEDVDITHQEHGTIVLPAGDWKVTRQREYRPDGWVTVAD